MDERDPASLIRHYARSKDPDQRTSMADARIALCIAYGIAIDDIDPASGYNYSRGAYDRARQSWVSNIKYHGFSEIYDRANLDSALANWTERRPEYTTGDDWLAAGAAAHHTYWGELGLTCNRGTCSLHDDPEPTAVAGGQLALDLTA